MKSNTKKLGLLGLLLTSILTFSFLDNHKPNLDSKNYALNNEIIFQVNTDSYLQKEEAEHLISSLGLKHKLLYDSVKFNFYSSTNEEIMVSAKYVIPERAFASLTIPIGKTNRKTLQQYLYSQEK